MKDFFKNIFSSFNNSPEGASARKLSAFYGIVIMGGVITCRFCSVENAVEMLICWLTFGALCLGLVTMQQIIELKNSKGTTP